MISRVKISTLSRVHKQRLVVKSVPGVYTAGGCWQWCLTLQKISILLKMFPSSINQTLTSTNIHWRWVRYGLMGQKKSMFHNVLLIFSQ